MRGTRHWRFSSRILVPVAFLVVTMIVLVAGVLLWAVERADRLADEREIAHVASLLAEAVRKIPHDQESVAIWDDAVTNAKHVFDEKWVDTYLGRWMQDYFGHDRAYLLDRQNRLVYGITENGRAGQSLDEEMRSVALPLVEAVRRSMRARSPDAPPPPAAAGEDKTENAQPRAVDVVKLGQRPAVVSAMPIVSDSGDMKQEPGSELVHVAVRFLDGGFVHSGLEEHLQTQARFSPAAPTSNAELAFRLQTSTGDTAGWFVWRPARPGGRLLAEITPVLIAAFLVVGAIIALLVFWLRRSSAELLASEAEAQRLALHDSLTGLPNRALFANRLEHALGGVRRTGEIAVLYIDLDHFKSVNDTLGHESGDVLIKVFGARLVGAARATDTVARIGGDEFAVLLTGLEGPTRRVEEVCDRILDLAAKPFDPAVAPAGIGVSIGVAVAPAAGVLPGDLLRNADVALYEAKRAGRNCFRVFREPGDTPAGPGQLGSRLGSGITPPSVA
jgi:diguanylate cyclase (GGDEF)-like protein